MSSVLEYTLPTGWKEDRLENIIAIGSSITYGVVQPGPEDEQGVPFVRGGDIYNGKIAVDKLRTISQDVSKTYKRTLLEGGELLMSLVGYPGEVAIVPSELVGANIARQAAYIKLDEKNDNKYLMYYLLSEIGKFFLFQKSTGSAQQVINLVELKEVNIILPLLAQQQKIAKILSTVDNLIEKTQTLIEKYTAIKQGMMADLFTRGIDMTTGDTPNSKGGKLRPSVEDAPELYNQTELGWVPKEWEVVSIDEILDRIIDYRGKTPTKTDEGIPLITAKNVRFGYVDPEPREFIAFDAYEQWMTRGIPKKGDVLFTTEAPLANVAQIESDEKIAFAQRMIILQTSRACNNVFLKHLLMSEGFRKNIFSRGSGSTVEGVKQSEFKKVLVKIPTSTKEQELIVSSIESLVDKISTERKSNKKYKEQKKGLMQDLLTGNVRVN